MLEASVARWAYDRITGLEAALAAVTGSPLRTDPEPTAGPHTGTWRLISGGGSGKTASQDEIVDAALRRGESVDRVSADGVEHLDPDDDPSLCDAWCPGQVGGPHQHIPRD
jgi:hypothetical protein